MSHCMQTYCFPLPVLEFMVKLYPAAIPGKSAEGNADGMGGCRSIQHSGSARRVNSWDWPLSFGCLRFAAIPLYSPAQAFFKGYLRRIPQLLFCARQVRQRVLHVSGALWPVFCFAGVSNDCLKQLKGFVQIETRARCHIEDFTGDFPRRRLCRKQVCVDGIVDVSEVTALLAIAENRWLHVREHLGNELRENAGVLRSRILARSKDIEVTQANRLKAIAAEK